MAENRTPKKIVVKKAEPVPKERTISEDIDYEPAPETEMDFQTVEDDQKRRKNVTIGIVLGILLAAVLIGGAVYAMQQSRIANEPVPTTTTTVLLTTGTPNLATTTDPGQRVYESDNLTVQKDENGIWRAYDGSEKTSGYTGVVQNANGWWYVKNDVVDFTYNGLANNDYGTWVIKNGKVDFSYNGNYEFGGHTFVVKNGKVVGTADTTTTTQSTTAKDGSTVTAHEHHWVSVYDGNATIVTGVRTPVCKCPECGLLFKDRELLESHALAERHTLSEEPADDVVIPSEDSEVITGYQNEENTYWVCSLCGAETHNAEDVDVGL